MNKVQLDLAPFDGWHVRVETGASTKFVATLLVSGSNQHEFTVAEAKTALTREAAASFKRLAEAMLRFLWESGSDEAQRSLMLSGCRAIFDKAAIVDYYPLLCHRAEETYERVYVVSDDVCLRVIEGVSADLVRPADLLAEAEAEAADDGED